jgi:glyoxylase-like metal-dependent hydrolase (beta-lactamase superfamily II)
MKLTPNVHKITDKIVNMYLIIDEDKLLLIDSGLPHFAGQILKYIKNLGFSYKNLLYILLTHSDGDHVGSAATLRDATGAKIYSSSIEAEAMKNGIASRVLTPKGLGKMFYKVISGLFRTSPFTVDEILTNQDVLPFLGGDCMCLI